MRKKPFRLQSSQYILLLESFTEWLQLLNYSEFSIPGLSRTLREFFYYQEATGKLLLAQLTATDANGFIELLKAKGIYSSSHINKQIQSLKLFSLYIRETKKSEVKWHLLYQDYRSSIRNHHGLQKMKCNYSMMQYRKQS